MMYFCIKWLIKVYVMSKKSKFLKRIGIWDINRDVKLFIKIIDIFYYYKIWVKVEIFFNVFKK